LLKLEIGCGGRLPVGFIGVDIIRRVKSGNPFVTAEAKLLPFRSDTIDEVSCSHMVEHLNPRYFVACLSEWWRVLKENGKVTIRCPNAIVYLKELTSFFQNGGVPKEEHTIRGRPYELWPIINTTGLASMGDHMVNRNHFSLDHLKFYLQVYGGFHIESAEVVQTRQNGGVEHRVDGDLLVVGVKIC